LFGFKKILFYDYSSRLGVEHAAIGLKLYLKRHVKGGRIDLIGHSMGGLVARTYIQLLGGARRVDHCVTLGSPHTGTYSAYWLPNRVGEELRPDSDILRKLAATFADSGKIKFCSIVGGSDNIVLPRASGPYSTTLSIPDCGHFGLLVSKTVMSEVAKFLQPDPDARFSFWSPFWPKKIS
jgi:pimeloyl-ACP methyl ester carboxylesterase